MARPPSRCCTPKIGEIEICAKKIARQGNFQRVQENGHPWRPGWHLKLLHNRHGGLNIDTVAVGGRLRHLATQQCTPTLRCNANYLISNRLGTKSRTCSPKLLRRPVNPEHRAGIR